MALYDKLATTAHRLLTKYGRSVVLRQFSVGSNDYDPALGSAAPEGANTPNDTTRKALVLDQPGSQISQRFGQNLQANTLIHQSEKWLYIDAKGDKPGNQDKLVIDGMEYVIIDVQEMGPGGVPLFYMLVIRA